MNFKKFYSKYYNLVYKNKNYKSEVDYISRILKSKKKNIKNILELGSGTGAHAIHLLKKGFNLTCVEKSKDMIFNFKSKSKKIDIINSDLKKIRLKKKFDAVISMFHVINYMTKNKDLESFFRVASLHLNKGGLLLFDTWYYPAVVYKKPKTINKIFKDKNFKISRKAIPNQLSAKIFKIKYLINILDLNNYKNLKFSEVHKIRAFDIKELDKVSNKFDFIKIKDYAFLKKTKPNKKNWGALLLYKKI